MKRMIFALGLALFLAISMGAATAADPVVPGWMKWAPAEKRVELAITAAYNGNNGSWNYNGYYEGRLTIVVPLASTVLIKFHNPDGNYPHSVLITKAYAEDEVPDKAGRDQVALPRAYSNSPEQGCHSCKEDLRFKAKKAGKYYLFCGVVGHGQAGMWLHFHVSEAADAPHVLIADDAIDADDEPPKP